MQMHSSACTYKPRSPSFYSTSLTPLIIQSFTIRDELPTLTYWHERLNARHLMRRLVTISVDPNILGFSGFNVSYPTEHQDNGGRDPHLVYGNAQSPRLARSAPEVRPFSSPPRFPCPLSPTYYSKRIFENQIRSFRLFISLRWNLP